MNLLNDWVVELPLQQQAVLVLACRGCDGVPKEHTSKTIVRFLRGLIFRSALLGREMNYDERAGDFMLRPPEFSLGYQKAMQNWLPDIEAMPMHYVTHTMHAIEIIGYKYPDLHVRKTFNCMYHAVVDSLHLQHETEEALDLRLCDWNKKHWVNTHNTCEICDHNQLSDCFYCSLSGEPNPEAFSRQELVNALLEYGKANMKKGIKS